MASDPSAILKLDASPGSLLPTYIAPRGLTRGVAAGFVLSALAAWLAVGVDLAQMRQLHVQLSGTLVDAEQQHRVSVALRIAQGVLAGILGVTALGFLAWLYRLRVNVRALGVRKLAYTRSWSVLGFLIPVLNFVRPYQVMAEVWRASEPSVLDPFEWTSVEPPRLLTLWWASVVIAATLELAAFGLGQTAGVDAFRSLLATGVAAIADAATAVSASLGYFFVTRLAATQAVKHRRLLAESVRS